MLASGYDDNDDYSGGFSYRTTYTGDHYFSVNRLSQYQGYYSLSTGTDVGDDFVNVPKLSVATYYENVLEYTGDRDMVAVTLQGGKVYDLMHFNNAYESIGFELYDSGRHILSYGTNQSALSDNFPNWQSGEWWDSEGVGDFRAPYTGTYYLVADAYTYPVDYRFYFNEDRTGNSVWRPTTPTNLTDTLYFSNGANTVNSGLGDDLV